MAQLSGADQESSRGFARALSQLTALLLAEDPLDSLHVYVSTLAAHELPWVQSCGITSPAAGRPTTLVATDDHARYLDRVQADAQDGPCLDALNTGDVVAINDCSTETRYPEFTRRATTAGTHCVLALPLNVGEDTIAVLNLYGDTAHEFDPAELRVGQLFAAQAAMVLVSAGRYDDQVQLSEHLQSALISRAVIDQAIGMVMTAHHCSSAQAFQRLRTASQHRNVKLRDIATDMLAAVQQRAK